MADTKTDVKPVRKPRAKAKPVEEPTAVEADGFGAGIVEELATVAVAEPPRAEPVAIESTKPVRQVPPPAGPNEHGFDAETNHRYEEIKRGNTFITQLQQMTLAQLKEAAKSDDIPKDEWAGLKKNGE